MKPSASDLPRKLCKRCHKNTSVDMICPACKNDLIALYDNKLSWRTAYEVEKISSRAMLYTRHEDDEDLY